MSNAQIRLLLALATIVAIIVMAFNFGYGEQTKMVLLSIGLLILSLSIMVTIHEFGHFIAARMFGIRVDKFYIFFDFLFPLPHILNFALFKRKKGDTEYGIGWFPMGGYVQIAGMIDEQMDENAVAGPAQPWEFRSKPVWQRLLVMAGGVIMNVILGIAIFTGVKFKTGEEHLPMSEVKYGIIVMDNSIGSLVGFKTGDKVVSFKGKAIPYFDDYNVNLLLEDNPYFEVERNQQIVKLVPPKGILDKISDKNISKTFFLPEIEAYLFVGKDSPAAKAGLQKGDKVVRADSTPITTFGALMDFVKLQKPNQTISLQIERGGKPQTVAVTLNSEGRMGINPDLSGLRTDTIRYTLAQALIEGTKHAFSIVSMNAKGFSKIGSGEASFSKSVQGPVEIATMFATAFQTAGWMAFWQLTASLSMVLAFVNILPIPALDGGHIVFLLIEAVMRKEPSVRVRMIAQQIGMVIVLALMAFVLLKGFAGLM